MNLQEILLKLDRTSCHWRCDVDATVCAAILESDISNDIPNNIGDLPKTVLKYIPDAQFQIGNEYSRVLYVRDYSGKLTNSEFNAQMETIGEIFNANESNRQQGTGYSLSHCWRLWWD